MLDANFSNWAAGVRELATLVQKFAEQTSQHKNNSESSQVHEWQGELFNKLLPQVSREPFLIVAVCGGTNTGKSVILNHLAGHQVSRSHPLATQTKHPTCCVPQGFLKKHDLATIFPMFEIRAWNHVDDPLQEVDANLLFVREDETGNQHEKLLLLDTPDIDGVLQNNHRRAESVRHAADVLIAVLTQQKYNDAAVRDFFHAATLAEKSLMVVFNMVHWPRQEEHCRAWLDSFTNQTDANSDRSKPIAAYAVPWDGDAAESLKLPFHPLTSSATDPRRDLTELQFSLIKQRALRGSLATVLDHERGLPRWLAELNRSANEHKDALDLLSHDNLFANKQIPSLPTTLVTEEIWTWLAPRRQTWERVIDSTWRYPWQMLKSTWLRMRGNSPDVQLQDYRTREWDSMRQLLDQFLQWLDKLRKAGNPILRDVLLQPKLLSNVSGLYLELQKRLERTPLVSDEYKQYVTKQLDDFASEKPDEIQKILRKLQWFATLRPVVSLSPFVLDFLVFPGTHVLADSVFSVLFISADGISITAQDAPPIFRSLYTHLLAEREMILKELINELLLGDIVKELEKRAALPETDEWKRIEQLINELREKVDG